ncbi:MAG: guanylate kinase [Myxococcota bacterium]
MSLSPPIVAPPPGLLLVVSSPSGAGKTTLCRRLMKEERRLCFSVSYTTRRPRDGERDGVDYHFVDGERFQAMVDAGEFAEFAEVHANRYGTAMAAVEGAVERGEDVLFDIDYQGARQIKSRFGEAAVMVFILPPSIDELERRLRKRATESEEAIARRLAKSREELGHYLEYDYIVVNARLDDALIEMRAIYAAAHLRASRQRRVAEALLSGWR